MRAAPSQSARPAALPAATPRASVGVFALRARHTRQSCAGSKQLRPRRQTGRLALPAPTPWACIRKRTLHARRASQSPHGMLCPVKLLRNVVGNQTAPSDKVLGVRA